MGLMMKRRIVTKEQLMYIVNHVCNKRTIYGLCFRRSVPKCTSCGAKDARFGEFCPKCGGVVEHEANVSCMIPRIDGNEFFFFVDGSLAMKKCLLNNVKCVTFNDMELFVM